MDCILEKGLRNIRLYFFYQICLYFLRRICIYFFYLICIYFFYQICIYISIIGFGLLEKDLRNICLPSPDRLHTFCCNWQISIFLLKFANIIWTILRLSAFLEDSISTWYPGKFVPSHYSLCTMQYAGMAIKQNFLLFPVALEDAIALALLGVERLVYLKRYQLTILIK